MMNIEMKKKWVEALRSGKYKQGQRTLRYDNQFCCLGVLCDLNEPTHWKQQSNGTFHYLGATSSLPGQLNKKYDIDPDEENELMAMNDGKGVSFAEIADYIERAL